MLGADRLLISPPTEGGTTEGMMTMAKILTPAELATELGTDAKTTRKFLRSVTPRDEQPGKGSRWAIEGKRVRSLKTQFTRWNAEQEKARAERAAARAEVATAAAADVEDVTDEEPTDADLEALEDDTLED